MEQKGYVYILTNPSFRDNWVKIGKTIDLNKRLSELNKATGIPLPFKIYATIQTKKYEIIEKNMHDMFGTLAGSRINLKREFFEVTPQTAFEFLKKEGKLCDDVVIKGPEYYGDKDKSFGKAVHRFSNNNGNEIKKNTTLIAIMEALRLNGGKGKFKEIYKFIKSKYPEIYDWFLSKYQVDSEATRHFEANVRATIYSHTKGKKFRGNEIFVFDGESYCLK